MKKLFKEYVGYDEILFSGRCDTSDLFKEISRDEFNELKSDNFKYFGNKDYIVAELEIGCNISSGSVREYRVILRHSKFCYDKVLFIDSNFRGKNDRKEMKDYLLSILELFDLDFYSHGLDVYKRKELDEVKNLLFDAIDNKARLF